MKRIIFSFLIVMICSFAAVASEVENRVVQKPDTIPVTDSLDLFRDITDISKQIERRTVQSEEIDASVVIPQQLPPDTIPDRIIVSPAPVPPREIMSIMPLDTTPRYKNPLDSVYFRSEYGTLQLPERYIRIESMSGFTFRDTLFYNPLFLPMIFTGEMLPRELSFYPVKDERDEGRLIPREKTFAPRLEHYDFVRKVRRNYYTNYPDQIKYSVASFDTIPHVEADDQIVRETFNPFRELIKAETAFTLEAPGVEGATIKKKYWVRSGEHSFQLSQNYFSENWHRGGTNSVNFDSYNVFRANYRKEKVRFNNTLEWRLSISNSPDDSLRKYRIGNDLIRYYGDFGVDAFGKGWSYSMNLEAKSQMFDAYPVNSNDLRSAFISPLYVNTGIGLKYVLEKSSSKVRHRKVRWELALAPASINYTYVWNDSVDVKRFGIPEDKNSILDIGSTITSILKFNITRYITWDSRFTYFTSYEKVISEFDNTLNMALSNSFSTRININLRYDDGVPPDPKFKLLQMNQTLSFGLNYKW